MSAATPLPESPQQAPARSHPARGPRRSVLSLVPSPIRARRAPFVALLLVLLAGGLVALLLLNTASAQDAFRLHALQKKEAALAQEMQIYASKGDGLDDPAILAARATALGMIPGGDPTFLARGAPLPPGSIRVGNEVYIPGPVQVPVVPAPKATASVAAAKPKTVVKPKTAVKAPAAKTTTPVRTPVKTPLAKPTTAAKVGTTPTTRATTAPTGTVNRPTGAIGTIGTTAGGH